MAWKVAVERRHAPDGDHLLGRQALPVLAGARPTGGAEGVLRGAYVVSDAPEGRIDAITRTGVRRWSVCVEAQAPLAERGVRRAW